jgi:predicted ATPase
LVTIVGPGGIGKTRLAVAAAEQVLAARIFSEGPLFIDLAPLQEAGQILQALADASNFPFPGGDGPSSKRQLLDYLRQKKMLIIFDNFEHLLEGAALVADILQAAPGVKILVTSRERLHLLPEQVYPIDGLAIPDLETGGDAEEYSAVRLFLQSAYRNRPDFSLRDDDDLTHLARICHMVAGMPLALELAASWIDTLSLDEIASELQQGLDILEAELRDLPERQRSVRASFDYTWRRLDEVEQAVFTQLSIFRGGSTRAAAQEVTGAPLRQLSNLVNKSLIRFDIGHGRYEIHELLRQYGAEKLAEQPELEASTYDHHSNYYLQMMAGFTDDLKGEGQLQAMSAIEADLDNVLLAWNHACAQQNIEAIGMSLESLWRFQWNLGRRDLGEFEKAEADLRNGEAAGSRGIVLGRLLAPLGRSYAKRGATARAREMLEESLDLLLRLGATEERLTPLLFLAEVQESIEESNRLYREGLALARATGNRWAIGHALLFLGWNAQLAGDYPEAEQQTHEALKQFRQTGDVGGIVTSLAGLGGLALDRGRYEDALTFSRESRSVAHGFNPMVGLMGLSTMAQALYALGEYEEAEKLFAQGLTVFGEYGREDHENWLFYLGEIAFSKMDYARAAQLYEHSLARAVGFGNLRMVIRNQISQGRLQMARGNIIEARRSLYAALQSVVQSSWRPLLLDCLAASAALFAKEGNLEDAALLATLITADLASRAMTKERAEHLLAHIEKELSSEQMGAVRQRSRTSDLSTVAAQLLLELETPSPKPQR